MVTFSNCRLILSFFLLGLSFGSGPCLASCGPLLLAYLAGTQKNVPQSLRVYFLFSLSRILIYIALGVFLSLLLKALSRYAPYISMISGIFIIFIGILVALGRIAQNKWCCRLQELFINKDAKTIIIFGLLTGLIPCAPFISVISYIGISSYGWLNSLLYSASFGIGTALSPLCVFAVFAGLIPRILKNSQRAVAVFNIACGLVIIFLGGSLVFKAAAMLT